MRREWAGEVVSGESWGPRLLYARPCTQQHLAVHHRVWSGQYTAVLCNDNALWRGFVAIQTCWFAVCSGSSHYLEEWVESMMCLIYLRHFYHPVNPSESKQNIRIINSSIVVLLIIGVIIFSIFLLSLFLVHTLLNRLMWMTLVLVEIDWEMKTKTSLSDDGQTLQKLSRGCLDANKQIHSYVEVRLSGFARNYQRSNVYRSGCRYSVICNDV